MVWCAGVVLRGGEIGVYDELERRGEGDGGGHVGPAVEAAHKKIVLVSSGVGCNARGARRLRGAVVVHKHRDGLSGACVDAGAGAGLVEEGIKAGAAHAGGARGGGLAAAGEDARSRLRKAEGAAVEESCLGNDGNAAVEEEAGEEGRRDEGGS